MAKTLTPKARSIIKKLIAIFLPVFSVLFLISTTAIIIIIMKGYSIDIKKKELIRTGVLNIETHPSNATIEINGEYYGKTNKAIPNLKVGKYHVDIKLEEYFDYSRDIEIMHGIASPIIIPLIRDIKSETILKANDLENTIIEKTTDKFILLKESAPENGRITYSLSSVYTSKSFFDDPKFQIDKNLMSLNTFEDTKITNTEVSPTGQNLLIETKSQKTKELTMSLIPIKKDSKINLNLANNTVLTHYANQENTEISWAEDADYLIIETKGQVISYNVTSGTRIILLEKTGEDIIWNSTQTGIVVLRKKIVSEKNLYEIYDVSFNGNPLGTTISLSDEELPSIPNNIWMFTDETDAPLFIVNTEDGSFAFGSMFANENENLTSTFNTKSLGNTPVVHKDNISIFNISEEKLESEPILLKDTYTFVYLVNNESSMKKFVYNKKTADALTQLGRHTVLDSESPIKLKGYFFSEDYIEFLVEDRLEIIDLSGENIYTLATDTSNYLLGQNDTAVTYIENIEEGISLKFRIVQ